MTDALEMRAVSATVGAAEGAVQALEAGADALCLGHDLRPEEIHATVVDAVRSSIAAGRANNGLTDALRAAVVVRLHGAPLDARTLLAEHYGRQLVVVVRDAHRHTWERVAAQALLEAAPEGGPSR